MDWFLPRGHQLADNQRIKRMIAEGKHWQIFTTSLDCYALAVKPVLFEQWITHYSLPANLFSLLESFECYVMLSSGNYIISSLAQGPFPDNIGQVQAFSIAFNTTLTINPEIDLHDAIYIEEYSMILPVVFDEAFADNGIPYGKWLTGGINISIESIDRISKIMSWLPSKALVHAAKMAGFTDVDLPVTAKTDECENEELAIPTPANDTIMMKNRFTLIGRPELESFLNDNIIDIVLNQEQYSRMGISYPGATILYGPPGCGKTYAIERLVEYLGWKRFDIDSSTIASSYIHDTSKKISEVFAQAMKHAPSVLVIDEMEAFLSNRSMSGPSGMHHIEEVAEFLRRIPEAISNGVLVFAMTNMIDSIDPAILRRGRFDHIVEVGMASAEEIEELLSARFEELPVEDTVDKSVISKDLAGHPMSDVAFVLREAGRFAVKRKLEKIDVDCFTSAMNLLPKKKERAKIGF